jgi:Family of unknown function (DUF6498)
MSEFSRVVIALRVLAALMLTGFNLIPLYGIQSWGWDPFQLVLLYWGETVILLLCTLVHLACIPPAQLTVSINDLTLPWDHPTVVGMFALHAGGFVSLYLYFLCGLFGGNALHHVNNVTGFIETFFLASGAWAPLLLATLAGLVDVLTGQYHPAFVDAFARWLHITLVRPPAGEAGEPAITTVVGGLYVRIIVIGLAIIVGNQHAQRYGSFAPLFIVITLKTLVDLVIRLGPIFKVAFAPLLSGTRIVVDGGSDTGSGS